MLGRDGIAALIPHQGSMCLLERVVEWDDQHVVLETASHRSPQTPCALTAGCERSICASTARRPWPCMAGCARQVSGVQPKPGMLVSLRSVQFGRDYIEDLPGDLRVEAVCLQADAASLQYRFRVTHAEEMLAEGRGCRGVVGGCRAKARPTGRLRRARRRICAPRTASAAGRS